MSILQKIKNISLPIKVLLTLVLVDQITKLFVINFLEHDTNYHVIKGYFLVYPTFNLNSNTILDGIQVIGSHGLAVLYSIIMLAIVLAWKAAADLGCTNKGFYVGLAAIMSGGISNGVDRLHMVGTVDWITLMGGKFDYIFNIADVAIFAGFIMLMIAVVSEIRREINLGVVDNSQMLAQKS